MAEIAFGFRLPAEFRNKIWKYALGGGTIVPNHVRHKSHKQYDAETKHSLLRVCAQIFDETASFPGSLNTVCLDACLSPFRKTGLEPYGPCRFSERRIATVRICIYTFHSMGPQNYSLEKFVQGIIPLHFPGLRKLEVVLWDRSSDKLTHKNRKRSNLLNEMMWEWEESLKKQNLEYNNRELEVVFLKFTPGSKIYIPMSHIERKMRTITFDIVGR
jgi:hypothetical protein